MNAIFDRQFQKQFDKAPVGIREAWKERFRLFLKEPSHPFLHNHPLKGSFRGKRSINITGDWRAIYQEVSPQCVMFIALGTHNQLYK